MQPEFEYRMMTTVPEMSEIEELQRLVWGDSNIVPVAQLMAAIHNGGVVIAACHEGKPIGFCYGFAGFKQGKAHLCSHMLGILPAYRDWGIGRQLKLRQREWALENGYDKMTWTYDPLEARNAFLNLCKLGGVVKTYMESYYGDMVDGINQGLPSDRFLLEWNLRSERATRGVNGVRPLEDGWSVFPRLLDWELVAGLPHPVVREGLKLGVYSGILLCVPANIHGLKQEQLSIAMEWRLAFRTLCKEAFEHGYVAIGLLKGEEPVHAYVLKQIGEGDM